MFTFILTNFTFYNLIYSLCFSQTRSLVISRTSLNKKATNFQPLGLIIVKTTLKINIFQVNLMNLNSNMTTINFGKIANWIVFLVSAFIMPFLYTMKKRTISKPSWSGRTNKIKNSSIWIYRTYFRREKLVSEKNNKTLELT